jgi:dolichol-phosphate mannosyltransferase
MSAIVNARLSVARWPMNYSAGVANDRAPDLSMVVPTYNEREGLSDLVAALYDVATRCGLALEVIVVDDNSPDGTGALADALATTHPMRVVHRPARAGLGTAAMAGFAAATADTVGVMDADMSHPPSLVPALFAVSRASRADFVIASRYVPGGSTPGWPLRRRLASRLACWLARPLTPVRDVTSGFFVVPRALVTSVAIKAGGFKIGLELLMRVRPTTLVEVPYQFRDRRAGASKMNAREALGYIRQLKDLYPFRWSTFGRRPVRHEVWSPADVERAMRAQRATASQGAG